MLKVTIDGGIEPTGTSLRWLLSRFSHNNLLKELKNLDGISPKSFSPRNTVLTVFLKLATVSSSSWLISFLWKKSSEIWKIRIPLKCYNTLPVDVFIFEIFIIKSFLRILSLLFFFFEDLKMRISSFFCIPKTLSK